MWRRGLLGFGALALVAGILLSRRDARTPAPATPGEERVARGPRVTPEGWTPSWTGQRGVAGRRIGGRVTAGDAGVAAVVRLRLVEDTGAVLVEVATGGDGRFDLGVLPAAWY